MRKTCIMIGLLLLPGILGCGIGPLTIRRDRRNYMDAVSDSWKNQLLLNMVKLSYGDTPTFLDVSTVTAKYGVKGTGDFSFDWAPGNNSPFLRITGDYNDSPLIEYNPISGEAFARKFMAPIPACSLFRLVQAGFPIDLALRACVVSMNGIQNHYAGISSRRQADDEFFVICNQMRKLQEDGALDLNFKPGSGDNAKAGESDKDKSDPEKMYIGIDEKKAQSQADSIKKMLKLTKPPSEYGYEIINGGLGGCKDGRYDKIGIITQSVLGVIVDFASYIKVPKAHVLEDRVWEAFKDAGPNAPPTPPIRVNAIQKRPSDAFAMVQYKKYWFYIDDHDLQSKSMFTFLTLLFSLTETEENKKPILTIPVR